MQLDREWTAALVLGSAHSAQHFMSSLLPPLIPLLTIALGYPLWQLGLLVSLYSLVSGLLQAPMGEVSDRYDRRFLLPAGLGFMGLGYVLFGLAPVLSVGLADIVIADVEFPGPFIVMAAGMMVTGGGSSVVHPTGYPLVSTNVRASRKGRAMGIWGSASKFGDTLAPVSIAVLILVLTWDLVIITLGLVGVVYALALVVALGGDTIETRPPQSAGEEANNETTPGGARSVLEDRRTFVYPMLVVLFFFITRGVATKGVRTFVPAFITDVYGYSLSVFGMTIGPASLANVYFSALLLTAAIVQLIAGGLTDRYDHRKVIVGLFALGTVGLVALSYLQLSPLALFIALLVVGGSLWGANPARDSLISDISPAEWEGRTFGYLWTFTQALTAASPAIIGYIADISGIQDSFKFLALATLIAGGSAALLLSSRVYVEHEIETAVGSD